MSGKNRLSIRQFRSVEDILAIASISQLDHPVLSPYMELIIRGLVLPPGKQVLLIEANPGRRLNQDQIDGLFSMAELRMDAIDDAEAAEAESVGESWAELLADSVGMEPSFCDTANARDSSDVQWRCPIRRRRRDPDFRCAGGCRSAGPSALAAGGALAGARDASVRKGIRAMARSTIGHSVRR